MNNTWKSGTPEAKCNTFDDMQGEASGAISTESITTTELLQFWQTEAHYFEERARAQGASATAMISVSVAALAAGAIPLADGTALSSALVLAVPLLALLLWVTAVRQLIEMYRLTAYYKRADAQVAAIYSSWAPTSGPRYATWQSGGGRYEVRSAANIAWIGLALAVPLGGSVLYVSEFLRRVPQVAADGWWIICLVALVVFALVTVLARELARAHGTTAKLLESLDGASQ